MPGLTFRKLNDDFRGQGWAEIAPSSRPRFRRQPPPPPDTRPLCRHCVKRPVNRSRGLCWTCYYTPAIRDLYPSTHPCAARGYGDVYHNAPLADAPTSARPGTEAKILVMIARAERRECLFHPGDGLE